MYQQYPRLAARYSEKSPADEVTVTSPDGATIRVTAGALTQRDHADEVDRRARQLLACSDPRCSNYRDAVRAVLDDDQWLKKKYTATA